MNMRILFVRHGQTDWNKAGLIQGHVDIPLNETGIAQTLELREKLKGEVIDGILCSPLKRARQMAELLNENWNVEIKVEPRLIERDFGEFEGKGYDDFDFKKFWDYKDPLTYETAEQTREFYDRVFGLMEDLKKMDGTFLLVAHGGVSVPVRLFEESMDGIEDFSKFILHNGEVLRRTL